MQPTLNNTANDNSKETSDFIERSIHDKENPYLLISRDLIRNPSIPWDCRMLLAYLLSNSGTWKISLAFICKEQGIGKEKMQKMMRILIGLGFIKRTKRHNLRGHIYYSYIVSEEIGRASCRERV